MDSLILLGRVLFGGYFILMGMNHFMKRDMLTGYAASKGVPSPALAVAVSGFLLLGGGLGILLGAYVPYAVGALVLFLVSVSFIMHKFWAVTEEQKMGEMTNFLKNIALVGAALMLLGIPTP